MKKIESLPTNEQMVKIANFIVKELKNIKNNNVTIEFSLDKELLEQLDEHYFFINNKDAKPSDFIPSDEVELIISGLIFKFKIKENE